MRKGKCKIKDVCIYSFRTFEGCYAELCFGVNTVFEYEELKDGNFLLKRKGMNLSIPKEDFYKMQIVSEEVL